MEAIVYLAKYYNTSLLIRMLQSDWLSYRALSAIIIRQIF